MDMDDLNRHYPEKNVESANISKILVGINPLTNGSTVLTDF
jgi:hypothetical protein